MKEAISELPFASFSKRVLVRNHLNENEFVLHENGRAGEIHFHMNVFARRFVLTQRQNVTRKWSIDFHPVVYVRKIKY